MSKLALVSNGTVLKNKNLLICNKVILPSVVIGFIKRNLEPLEQFSVVTGLPSPQPLTFFCKKFLIDLILIFQNRFHEDDIAAWLDATLHSG